MIQSEGQVRHKLKQVLYRHLQKRIRAGLRKYPATCLHNQRVEVEGRVLGFARCSIDGSRVCDECLVGGAKTARGCGDWSPRQTKEEIRVAFEALCSKGRAVVAFHFPDAGALMWVLGEDVGYTLPPEDDEGEEGVEDHPLVAPPPEMPPIPTPADLPAPGPPADTPHPGGSGT